MFRAVQEMHMDISDSTFAATSSLILIYIVTFSAIIIMGITRFSPGNCLAQLGYEDEITCTSLIKWEQCELKCVLFSHCWSSHVDGGLHISILSLWEWLLD